MPPIPADPQDADGFSADRRLIDALTEHGVLPWDITPEGGSFHAAEQHG